MIATGPGWELRLGSCLDPVSGLASLADDSVDVCITDPPYEAEAHTKGRRTKVSGWRQAAARGDAAGVAQEAPLPFDAITQAEREQTSRHLARASRRWILVFCQVEAAHLWASALVEGGVEYVRTMVWTKPNAQPQFTGDRPGHGYESIVVAHRKGKKRWNGGGKLGVFDYSTVAAAHEKSAHPTTKPLPLMRELVSLFSDPDELILDPFAGSGSTGVAARMLGRRFLGWELAACARCSSTAEWHCSWTNGKAAQSAYLCDAHRAEVSLMPDFRAHRDNYHAIATRRLNGDEAKPRPEQPGLFDTALTAQGAK